MTAPTTSTPWVERFGTLLSVTPRRSRAARFVTFVLDCKGFHQAGIAFHPAIMDGLMRAGAGKRVWMKGPLEARRSAEGAGETLIKAIYFKVREPKPIPADDLTVLKGVGAAVSAKLAEQGITRFDQLAALDDDELTELDVAVSAIRGSLMRLGIREAAAARLADAEMARLAQTNAFA